MATGTIMNPREIKSRTITATTDSGGFFMVDSVSSGHVILDLVIDSGTDLVACDVIKKPSLDVYYGRATTENSSHQVIAYASQAITCTIYYLEG